MGEKIKDIGLLHFGAIEFTVELNNPDAKDREIHIQNKFFRLALAESVFYRLGAEVLLARKQLRILKGLDTTHKSEEIC